MKRYKKIILLALLILGIFILLCISVSISRNWELRAELRDLKAAADTVIITQEAPENSSEVKLAGQDLREFFSILKLEKPLMFHHCECAGGLTITFLKDGRELHRISCHHGLFFRGFGESSAGDVNIIPENQEKLRLFFEKHQIPFNEHH